MNHFIIIGLIFLALNGEHWAMDCFYSKSIGCSCFNHLLNCTGTQEDLLDLQELVSNISSIYSATDSLELFWNIENLMFPSNFTFSGLKVKNLSLGTGLESLESDMFMELGPELIHLNLQHNNLEHINDHTFSSLYNLKELNLDLNKLYEINKDMFFNLSQLEFLSISGNNLYRLESDFLSNLPTIQTMILNNNNFSSFSNMDIISLTLKTLFLQNCSIEGSLESNSLAGLHNLENADFSFNQLSGVDPHALSKLSNLKTLNLSHNMLEYLKDNAFSALYNLRSLDLKNNKLLLITENSFLNLTNLKYLDLSGNILQAFLHTYTSDLYSLEKINLQSNKIRIITADSFSASINLQEILLKGNSLECTCGLAYFASYLVNNSHISLGDVNSVLCNSPSLLKGTEFIKVNFTAMHCDLSDPFPDASDDDEYDYDDDEVTGITNSTDSFESTTENFSSNTLSTTSEPSTAAFTNESILISSHTINAENLTQETSTIASKFTTSPITTTELNVTSTSQSTAGITQISISSDYSTDISSLPTTDKVKSTTEMSTGVSDIPTVFAVITDQTNTSTASPATQYMETTFTSTETMSTTEISSIPSDIPIMFGVTTEGTNTSTVAPVTQYTETTFTSTETISTLKSIGDTESQRSPSPTTAFPRVTQSELLIHILNFTPGKRFCVTWKVNGNTDNLIKCVLKVKSPYAEIRNLKCPTSENETSQCVDDIHTEQFYGFCIHVILNDMRKKSGCHTTELPSSSVSSSINITTELTTVSTPLVTKPTVGSVIPFKVTSFNVTFDNLNSLASVNWTVNKIDSKSICNLELILQANNFNHTRGVFNCANKSYVIKVKELEVENICLKVSHNFQKDITLCKSLSHFDKPDQFDDPGHFSEPEASQSKDYGYTNTSLIAVICLLIIVLILIIIIAMKKLLKNRIESERYDVSAEEKKVQKRISRNPSEPYVRYSYTAKERKEV